VFVGVGAQLNLSSSKRGLFGEPKVLDGISCFMARDFWFDIEAGVIHEGLSH